MLKRRYGGWLRHVFVINRALKRGDFEDRDGAGKTTGRMNLYHEGGA